MLHITIILVNRNGFVDTIECLKSIKHIKYEKYNIIVVDNGSSNNSVSIIQKYINNEPVFGNKINLIIEKKNHGFSGGNNIGIKYAIDNLNTDILLLLNNDTVIEDGYISEIIERIKIINYSSLGCFGGTIRIYGSQNHQIKLFEKHKTTQKVDTLSGAGLFIPKHVIAKNGYLDDLFFLYFEDADFCLRTLKNGFINYYIPTVNNIYHKIGNSSKKVSEIKINLYLRNAFIIAKRNKFGYKFIRKHLKSIIIEIINKKNGLFYLPKYLYYIIKGMISGIVCYIKNPGVIYFNKTHELK